MTQPRPEGEPGRSARITRRLRATEAAYSPDEARPLGGYVATLLAYGGLVGAVSAATRLSRRPLPEAISPWDVTLISLATYRLSRTLTKNPVTSPLRAPFTRYTGLAGPAELSEEVRGSGVRHAMGELVTCPFCLAQWVATGLVAGHLLAPRATRAVTATLTAVAMADFAQVVHARAHSPER